MMSRDDKLLANARPVVPNLFECIPPLAHFGTFHSSPITLSFFERCFLTTLLAHYGVKHNLSQVL